MRLRLADIHVSNRLREDLGNLDGLAESLSEHGLIHAVVVDEHNVLIAGGRRLAAAKQLGWKTIEARRFGELSQAERRVLELEENLHRKDLTAYERSKATVETVDAAKQVAREGAKRNGVSDERRPKRGRPKQPDSEHSAAERVGLPRVTVRDAEAHVAVADRYPMMQSPEWSQRAAVKVGKMLDALPAREAKRIVALCERAGAHAKAVEKMVATWSELGDDARDHIWQASKSTDPRERALSTTTLADVAPDIDDRVVIATDIGKRWRHAATLFKGDPENERILKEAERADAIAQRLREQHQKRIAQFEKQVQVG